MFFFSRLKLNELSQKRIILALKRRLFYPFQLVYFNSFLGINYRNRLKLKGLKNTYKGKRCFIIASGPSLKYVDFSLLKNEFTIAMNRGYLLKDKVGLKPSMLVCIDMKTHLEQFYDFYNSIDDIPTFYNWRMINRMKELNNRYYIFSRFSSKFLRNNIFGGGKTVTYTCIQLAFHMGFKEVYIIGKDHSYIASGKPSEHIRIKSKSKNHFLDSYYKKNQIFDYPDFIKEEHAYRVARKYFEKNNRIIRDATYNGNLTIFEKINFNEIFN